MVRPGELDARRRSGSPDRPQSTDQKPASARQTRSADAQGSPTIRQRSSQAATTPEPDRPKNPSAAALKTQRVASPEPRIERPRRGEQARVERTSTGARVVATPARAEIEERGKATWKRPTDPRRIALLGLVVALLLCIGLLVDIFLGHDPVHLAVVSAFGPLAFVVPVGVALWIFEIYRRHEGKPEWLRFEESCGAVLMFVTTLTLLSLVGIAPSLIGSSLGDEIVSVTGPVLGFLLLLLLLVIGAVLFFRITLAQVRAAAGMVGRVSSMATAAVASLTQRAVEGRRRRHDARQAHKAAAAQDDREEDDGVAADEGHEAAQPVRLTFVANSDRSPAAARAPATLEQGGRRGEERGGAEPMGDKASPAAKKKDWVRPRPAATSPPPQAIADTIAMWRKPTLGLLDPVPPAVAAPTDHDERSRVIEDTLMSFNVAARVVEVQSGPTVTQFGLRPDPGVRVQRITALSNDLALALAAPSIRIEAPVPGKPVVGIEIPNGTTTLVTLREIMESQASRDIKSPLRVALGKNVSGKAVVVDLAGMPHLLIAGATGSGKSVCLNSLIACLLFNNSPAQVRLLMIDPKMVELTTFNGVPHLLHPVVTDMDKVNGTLKWVLKEMHRRYKLFGEAGVRNLARFNERQEEKLTKGEPAISKNMPLPYIVFIIDELADLMMVSPADVEDSISRLAALARATGIHLVLATQRPSVDVITGVIKANFPARIAFAVSSQVDSRTILDMAGAEKLMGRGDMLYLPSDGSKAMRVQGAYLSDKEIERLVDFWKEDTLADGPPLETIPPAELESQQDEGGESGGSDDKLLSEATRVVREYRRASVSLLQRRLGIGYSRAARLIDMLEERGVVGQSEDGKSRVVLDAGGNEMHPAQTATPVTTGSSGSVDGEI